MASSVDSTRRALFVGAAALPFAGTAAISAPPTLRPYTSLKIAGLISLYEALEGAQNAFIHETNTDRVTSGSPTETILEDEAERCGQQMSAVIREVEARRPNGAWEREYRASLLARHYTKGLDWAALAKVAGEMAAGTQDPAHG